MTEIKKYPMYDVGWLAKVLQPISSQIKVVCLDRGFPNLVASHRDWDGGLEMHASVMAVYKQFISELLVTVFPSDDWVVLQYEALSGDLSHMEMITAKLGHFFGELLDAPTPRSLFLSFFPSLSLALSPSLPSSPLPFRHPHLAQNSSFYTAFMLPVGRRLECGLGPNSEARTLSPEHERRPDRAGKLATPPIPRACLAWELRR